MNPIPVSQLSDALRWRYATKAFDATRKLPAATWSALEETLVLSASSFGLQPYRFLVVEDPGLRAQLVPHSWNQRQVVDASHLVVFAARTQVTEAEIDAWIQQIATTRGVTPASLAGYRGMMTGSLLNPAFQSIAPHWTARQAYIALGSLLTAAALLGVDTCPIEGFTPAEYDRLLGLPAQGLAAVVACALGYRAESDKYAAAPKVRFPASQLIVHVGKR
jgi:nitroreductase